jgi:nucleotide-binding universal stress UspA family protein
VVGAPIHIVHVSVPGRDEAALQGFIEKVRTFAERLRVFFRVERVELGRTPSVRDIARVIVDKGAERRCQLIVMAAQREAFFRELFGRISDRVTRTSRLPVVLVETPRRGLKIPERPRRIMVAVLEEFRAEPFTLASMLTSSATAPEVELLAVKVVELPMATPLDALGVADTLRREEREFAGLVGDQIKRLGRLFTPRMLATREAGSELAEYAAEAQVDLIVTATSRPGGFRRLLAGPVYELVARAPCVVLVYFPGKGA